jgi:hypothetical protein
LLVSRVKNRSDHIMKEKLKISAIFAAILLVSIAFVPAVSAQADISQNKEYADAIDISNKKINF